MTFHFNSFDRALDKLKEGRWKYDPPETPHEKFYYMVKKNPKLLKLKKELDLEVMF